MLFQSNVYFASKDDRYEKSHLITFEADSMEDAIIDTGRWFENRHSAMPSHFTTLYCVKIYEFQPQRVDTTGYLPASTGLFGYEWKYDWGKPYGR